MLFVGGHAVQKLVNPRTEMMPRKSNVTGEGRGRGKTALARCKQWAKHSVRPSLLEEGIIHQSHTRRTRRRTRASEGVFSKATVHPECKFHRWAASLKALRPFYNPQNRQTNTHIACVVSHWLFSTLGVYGTLAALFCFFAKTKRCCLQTITAFTTWLVSASQSTSEQRNQRIPINIYIWQNNKSQYVEERRLSLIVRKNNHVRFSWRSFKGKMYLKEDSHLISLLLLSVFVIIRNIFEIDCAGADILCFFGSL